MERGLSGVESSQAPRRQLSQALMNVRRAEQELLVAGPIAYLDVPLRGRTSAVFPEHGLKTDTPELFES